MEILVLDVDLKIIDIIDTFESLIWTEKYNDYGDFEIYTKVSNDLLTMFSEERYIKILDSDRLMVVEDIQVKSDSESGSNIIIKGRSIESLLDRRIIWSKTILSGSLQNGIKKLLDENAISPAISDRTIPNLTFEFSTDPNVLSLEVDVQLTYDNLYESMSKLCVSNNIGFRMVSLDDLSGFKFQLYSGSDRSYDQLENPYVVFSPEFDNIINSDYSKSTRTFKTLTLVGGEGEGASRKIKIVGSGSGLERREMHTDARDLSQEVDGVQQTNEKYYSQLEQRGLEDLSENTIENSFDSQVDTTKMFKYGEDFFLGDIVQMVSEYGLSVKARVTEIVRSQNTSGIEVYPKFTIIY